MSGPPRPVDRRREVEVTCSCGHSFGVPKSLRGGVTNCPGCGTATPVRAGTDVPFVVVVTAGSVALLFATVVAWQAGGAVVAAVVFAIGAVIGGIALAAS